MISQKGEVGGGYLQASGRSVLKWVKVDLSRQTDQGTVHHVIALDL